MKKTILTIFGVICLVISIVFFVFNFVIYPKKYQNYVLVYANQYNLDPNLIYSIIKSESNFDKNAVSRSGARGLMQLLPSTARWIASEIGDVYSDDILFRPDKNVEYGCFYLCYLMNKFENIDAVVCAYNAGEGVVRSWLKEDGSVDETKIAYNETKNYLKKVKSYYFIYKNDFLFV